jgi:hypothetical protein
MISEGEAVVLSQVAAGVLCVDEDGCIWRRKTRSRTGRLYEITPIRADHLRDDGYRTVRVNIDGQEYFAMAHRVVWSSANGLIPDEIEINHEDGNRGWNALSNLSQMTSGENLQHSYDVLDRPRIMGERALHSKLTESKVAEIRRRFHGGESKKSLARSYGVSPNAIRKVVSGQSWPVSA